MRDANSDSASRLSGEAPLRRHYVKSRAATGFLSGGGYPSRGGGGFGPRLGGGSPSPGFFDPFVPVPTGPQPPDPRSAPIPFKPINHNYRRFGQKAPFAPSAPALVGGMTKKGYKYLRRLAGPFGFLLGFIPDEPIYNGGRGVLWWDFPAAGFTLRCEVPPNGGAVYNASIPYSGPDTRSVEGTSNPNLPCTLDGQVADDNLTNGAGVIASTTRWMAIGPDNHGVVVRMQLRQQWTRPAGTYPGYNPLPGAGNNGIPQRWGRPYEDGPFWPAVDPFGLPVAKPQPNPRPIPWRAIPERRPNPGRDPIEQPGGEEPSTPPVPRAPRPGTSIKVPEIVITAPPGPGGSINPPRRNPNGVHVRRPPFRGRERERKTLMNRTVWNFLNGALGIVTESLDMLGVFFDSLPWEVRRQYRWEGGSPIDRLAFVLENLEHIRLGDLIANLIANQIEDYAYGRFGRQAAEMNKLLHQNFGIDLHGRLPKRGETPELPDSGFVEWLDGWLNDNLYDPIERNTGVF